MRINAANAVRYWASATPEAVAIHVDEEDVTWAELHERTSRLANGFAARGVKARDRVGIFAPNCLAYCETTLAAMKLGALVVPLNVRLAGPELTWIVEHADCRALVVHDDLAETAKQATAPLRIAIPGRGSTNSRGEPVDALRDLDSRDPDVEVDGPDPAFLCYTSGTTGRPKGAILSHENVWSQACHRILADDWTSADRIYLPFPLAFTGGMIANWMPTYFAGARLVLDPAFDAARTLAVIEQQAISVLMAVPVIWETLVRHPAFEEADLSSLRFASAGGAPVPEVLLRTLQDRGIRMSQGYGLTEGSGMTTTLRAEDALRKRGAAGLPTLHTRVKVIDAHGAEQASGEVGELCIRGPDVMVGYWNDPDATAEAIRDGWLHTGDLARIDDEGYVQIVDRAKDLLISGGLNVYPAEIERVLASVEGLTEVAVIGVADPQWGEVPAAIVHAPDQTLDVEAIRRRCREELADYKVPRYVVEHGGPLPRGMSGKILKRELRALHADLSKSEAS